MRKFARPRKVLVSARGGTAIGGGADDGALLGAVDIDAADLIYAAGGKMQMVSGDPHQTLRLTPTRTNDLRVEPGEGYYLELSVKSGSAQYAVGRILNYYGRQPVGLRRADHQDNNSRPQQKRSGNWSNIDDHVDATNYILLGMALHFDI